MQQRQEIDRLNDRCTILKQDAEQIRERYQAEQNRREKSMFGLGSLVTGFVGDNAAQKSMQKQWQHTKKELVAVEKELSERQETLKQEVENRAAQMGKINAIIMEETAQMIERKPIAAFVQGMPPERAAAFIAEAERLSSAGLPTVELKVSALANKAAPHRKITVDQAQNLDREMER